MRKFSHQETLVIAFNIIYVASFVALLAFITTNAKETEVIDTSAQEYYYNTQDCMNCDEVD